MRLGLSIRTRLTLVIFAGVLLPLCVALVVVAAYEIDEVHREFSAQSALLGSMVSEYAAVDMAFEDQEEAEKTLSKLAAQPDVLHAALYDRKGRLFATYRRPGGPRTDIPERIVEPVAATFAFAGDHYDQERPVVYGGTRYGTLGLRLSTAALQARARAYRSTAIFTAASLAVLGFLFAFLLQRLISRPILDLAAVVRRVAREGDYSIRASARHEDEIGVLANGFNTLLAEVARRKDEAQRAIEVRDDFLSVASHELNTPLTSLKLALQGLEPGGETSEDSHQRLVELAVKQVSRLELLVAELLDVTRLRRGTLQLTLADMDLVDLVNEVGARLTPNFERSRSQLEIEAPGPIVGRWDRSRLDQVVTNLLVNAIKFGEGRPIRVEMTQSGARARLVVRDHGRGIPPERIDRIFDAYERAVPTAHYGGLGLGLFIVRSLVEQHGGSVRAESAGDGTAFVVELPVQPQDDAPAVRDAGLT
jgi:signal transduction histidine kinase